MQELKTRLLELKAGAGCCGGRRMSGLRRRARETEGVAGGDDGCGDGYAAGRRNKLRPYTEQSQATLERSLGDLSGRS